MRKVSSILHQAAEILLLENTPAPEQPVPEGEVVLEYCPDAAPTVADEAHPGTTGRPRQLGDNPTQMDNGYQKQPEFKPPRGEANPVSNQADYQRDLMRERRAEGIA